MGTTADPNPFDRCNHCGATLAPGTTRCPSCNTRVPVKNPRRSLGATAWGRRHLRHLLIAAILLVLPHVPQVRNLVPYRFLFWTSPLVLEAVTRANQHPETEALLGKPINAGWLSRGYVRGDETGWSEGKIWIPVNGIKSSGIIYARGGQADGPWVFSELRLVRADSRALDLLSPVVQPSLASRKSEARIYLVPINSVQGLGLDELPDFYRTRHGLSVQLLEPVPLDPKARNTARKQLIFEELIRLMHARYPQLAKDKSAFLIGITDEDMYIKTNNWNFAYTAYSPKERAGVVSSARFIPEPLAGKENLLRARIRKMVSRTIGFVVFELPRSNDPSSVMYRDLYGSASADLMSDSFEGLGSRAVVDEFRSAHGMEPAQAEIPPEAGNFDFSKVDGRYPCVRITKAKGDQGKSLDVKLTKCLPQVYLDVEVDEIEVDLRIGNLVARTTDLLVSGAKPLAITRCYRSWANIDDSFGRNTALSWDLYPTGSRQPYTYINVNACGNQLHFVRISKGTGYADAVYEHRATATAFLGSRFSWNGNGWDLKLRDESIYVFPESYHAKKPIDGALIRFRDAQGQAVKLERTERRSLKRIASPDGRFVTFDNDSADRIYQIEDDQKRRVDYLYDHGGRLVEVRGLRGIRRFEYDSTYLMKIEENDRPLAQFDYDRHSRIRELKLPDGRIHRFEYEYDRADPKRVVRTIVTDPDGAVAKFDVSQLNPGKK
jgi:YD repeat-containing protein